jgi:dipeptidase
MCDTLTALPPATATGSVLFAKNSDRERNEAQSLESHPARRSQKGARLRLTYMEIDEVELTLACILSRPFWMWGAEMGANAAGVVIGNEAMHSIIAPSRQPALTGMDLVRLGLERGATARQAVEVITGLLEAHGQGGNCGHLNPFHYHNGFIIADPMEAYVLETVGKFWIVEKVSGVRALSNALSIGADHHAISPALLALARAEHWLDVQGRFDFAERLIDPVKDAATFGRGRCARAAGLLAPKAGRIGLADMLAVLRDHGEEAQGDDQWSPRKTKVRSICMHAANGARRSQSVASMASDLAPGRITHWFTATSAPCLSLFRPVVAGLPLPDHGPTPTDQFDPQSLWWRHEQMHRTALARFSDALADIAPEREALEAKFRTRMAEAWTGDEAALTEAIQLCWTEAEEAEASWRAAVTGAPKPARNALGRSGALAWARLNQAAGFRAT